uniref:Uncharacterized protein n=1 Tax=Cacopsylla melanoneura TaxID=428564 RepID=A0A8D8SRL8_9HEMI
MFLLCFFRFPMKLYINVFLMSYSSQLSLFINVDTPNSELTMLTPVDIPKRYPQGLYSEGGRNIGGLQHNDFYVLMSTFLLTSIVPFDHLLPLCPVIPPWYTALKILRPILHFPDRKHVYHR